MSARIDSRTVILHIITRMIKGGAQENTLASVLGVNRERYRSILVTGCEAGPEGSLLEVAHERGADVRVIPSLVREVSPLQDAAALISLVRVIRKERPAIVHTHTSKAGILGRVAARIVGVPAVIHTPHGHIFHDFYGPLKTRMFVQIERFCARLADRLVMLTDNELQDHLSLRIAPAEKFTVVHSGIEFSKFEETNRCRFRQELGIPKDVRLIGTVGRLVHIKGQIHLIEAMPKILQAVPNAYLAIVGSGPLRESLEEAARAAGVAERVRFAGFCENVADCLADMDVFALPSLNEGMGRALVEAMAMRLPVVASAVSGIKDLVVDGRNGLLVPAADPGALATSINRLLHDSALARQMGDAAYATAVPVYSIENMIRRLEDLYSEVSNGRGEPETLLEPAAISPQGASPVLFKAVKEDARL